MACLSSDCLLGTYSSISNAPIGDLESGAAVCIPCDPLCDECRGPGTQWPTDCHKCRYATHIHVECVEICNATSGEEAIVAWWLYGFTL